MRFISSDLKSAQKYRRCIKKCRKGPVLAATETLASGRSAMVLVTSRLKCYEFGIVTLWDRLRAPGACSVRQRLGHARLLKKFRTRNWCYKNPVARTSDPRLPGHQSRSSRSIACDWKQKQATQIRYLRRMRYKKMGGIDSSYPAQRVRLLGWNCYGVSLLIRVFQSASAVRVPGP